MGAVIGYILGAIILIFTIICVIGMFRFASNYDFNAPVFRTEIKIPENIEIIIKDGTEEDNGTVKDVDLKK